MIQVDEKERIRNAYHVQGQSIREISRRMRHSRKTVRKAIADASVPVYVRTRPVLSPVMDPVRQIVDEWIEQDGDRPRKQRHTAHRIYERLREEQGFTGAESTVRRYVGKRRRRPVEHFVPLCFDPGAVAQVDFGEAVVVMDGSETEVQFFCMRLCYSRRPFVMALPFQKQEAFLEAHVRAFDLFGGVPRRITYDNLTAATARAIRGDKRREIDSFVAFRSHYLFASHFCTPGEAHEKGQVENLVGYVRRNWFVPLPRVKGYEDLNSCLLAKCLAEEKHVIQGMKESVGQMFARERANLLALPARPYECFRLHPVRSNKMGLIRFEGNDYSVPAERSSQALFLKAYMDRVEITDARQVLAIHRRLLGKGKESLQPVHYLEAMKRKPGSLEYARPLRSSEFSPVYYLYLERLKDVMPDLAARRSFVKVLELSATYPEWMVAEAMALALEYGSLDADAVKNLLAQKDGSTTLPLSAELLPQGIADVRVEVRDVRVFDRLLSGVGR